MIDRKEYQKQYRETHKEQAKKYRETHKEEIKEFRRQYTYRNGGKSMLENKDSSLYLGIHIAEHVLSKVFKDVQTMPIHNHGFDYLCNKGYKIDVKSSCMFIKEKQSLGMWKFNINKNCIADFFLCLAFDNRNDLNPLYLWLLPDTMVNSKTGISISKSTIHKWDEYKLNINKVVSCCNTLKGRA